MFPPKVSDHQIDTLIAELGRAGRLPSGAALRRALRARFGTPGGVARVYALLAAAQRERATTVRAPFEADDPQTLQSEVHSLRLQLQLAREREEADQSRWAQEIDRLRLKVAQLEPLAHQSQMLGETADLLRHRLQAADVKLGLMEDDLLRALRQLEEHRRT